MRLFSLGPVILLSLLVAGCGGGGDDWTEARPQPVPAAGLVTLDGSPVEGATVTLTGAPDQPAAFAQTGSDGRFVLSTYGEEDGAVPGTYAVGVRKVELKTVPNPEDPNLPPISSEEIYHLPKKYSDPNASGLTLTIPESGDEELRIELE